MNRLKTPSPPPPSSPLSPSSPRPSCARKPPSTSTSKVLHQIKTEAFQHSQVMDHLFYIADVYGPPRHRLPQPPRRR